MNMGLGALGGSQLIIKRNYRWSFEINGICGGGTVPASFLKSASRPSLEVDETELNYLNATTWIPGKAKWQPITVTYYDVADVAHRPLWNWLASVYNFTDPVALQQASKSQDYAGVGILVMYDGCGTPLEQWTLNNVWPQGINFGELAMDDPEFSTIELTLRYTSVIYQSLCPGYTPQFCCSPCTGSANSGGNGLIF